MNRRIRLHFASALLVFGAALDARAQDGEEDRGSEHCISLPRIDHTEVIDDQTILFYARGNRVYRNYLPRQCPGLEREQRFMYEVRNNQLCSSDAVSVLESWGSGLARGFLCPLGEFQELSEEELEEIKRLDAAADAAQEALRRSRRQQGGR